MRPLDCAPRRLRTEPGPVLLELRLVRRHRAVIIWTGISHILMAAPRTHQYSNFRTNWICRPKLVTVFVICTRPVVDVLIARATTRLSAGRRERIVDGFGPRENCVAAFGELTEAESSSVGEGNALACGDRPPDGVKAHGMLSECATRAWESEPVHYPGTWFAPKFNQRFDRPQPEPEVRGTLNRQIIRLDSSASALKRCALHRHPYCSGYRRRNL